jgi:hypothetical protein
VGEDVAIIGWEDFVINGDQVRFGVWSGQNSAVNGPRHQVPIPRAGTLRRLQFTIPANTLGVGGADLTVLDNLGATLLTTNIPGGFTGQGGELVITVPILAAHDVQFELDSTPAGPGGVLRGSCSVEYVPT